MARTMVLICFMAVVLPIAALADSVGPVFLGNGQMVVGPVVPRDEGPVSPENELLAVGVGVPSDDSGLMSPLLTEESPMECLRTSADSERPNSCPSLAGIGFVDLPVVAQLEPTSSDLKPFLLAVFLLGGLWHFLTSPYYTALWDRLFSPLNWS